MVTDISILVALVMLVDRIPMPNPPVRRGRPKLYPDRLFVKALVIMIVRKLSKVNSLLAVLEEPSPEMQSLRALLTEVCRIFHQLRSRAIENFNAQFKAIFGCLGQVPTKGLIPTSRFALGAVLVYQLSLLHRFENEANLRVGLKPYLQAA